MLASGGLATERVSLELLSGSTQLLSCWSGHIALEVASYLLLGQVPTFRLIFRRN